MIDPYGGDPKIILTAYGADLDYGGTGNPPTGGRGQPTMDQGVENWALLALFTTDWVGNVFFPAAQKLKSPFETTFIGQGITIGTLNQMTTLAASVLKSAGFPEASATATNPQGDRIAAQIVAGPGQQPLSLQKLGPLWQNQAQNPASQRVVATS